MDTDVRYSRAIYIAVLLAVVVAIGFRTHALTHASLWGDEAYSVILAQAPWGHLLTRPITEHAHPPLYYAIVKTAGSLFDLSEETARAVSVVFGVCTVVLIVVAGRVLGSVREGVVAACLLAWSFTGIYTSQLVRMYSLLALISLAAFVLLAKALADRGWIWWVGYVVCGVAVTYTHYFGALVISSLALGGAVSVILNRERRARGLVWGKWAVSHLAIGIAFLPWSPFVHEHFRHLTLQRSLRLGEGELSVIWLVRLTVRLVSTFSFGGRLPGRALGGVSVAFFLALALWGLVRLFRRRAPITALLTAMIAIPALVLILLSPKDPSEPPIRYMAFLLPPYLLLLAAGMAGLAEAAGRRLGRWAVVSAFAVLLFISLALGIPTLKWYYESMTHADYRQVVRLIEERGDSDEALICFRAKDYALLDWYATHPRAEAWHILGVDFPWESRDLVPGLTFPEYSSVVGTGPRFVQWADSVESVAIEGMESILQRSPGLWFVYDLSEERRACGSSSILDPTGLIMTWLEDRYWRRELFEGDSYSVILYEVRRDL